MVPQSDINLLGITFNSCSMMSIFFSCSMIPHHFCSPLSIRIARISICRRLGKSNLMFLSRASRKLQKKSAAERNERLFFYRFLSPLRRRKKQSPCLRPTIFPFNTNSLRPRDSRMHYLGLQTVLVLVNMGMSTRVQSRRL